MKNGYDWVESAENVVTVCAEYDDREYGSYFRDDTPEDRISVRPGAGAKAYRIANERNLSFSSPEETLLHLTAKYPGGFALVLQDMNNAESAKFEKLWRQMVG